MKNFSVKCTDCETSDCWILKFCSKEWIDFVANNKVSHFYKKKQHVIYEKTLMEGIYFIHFGKVKVYKSGIGKKQQIVRLSKTGDILGHRGFNREYWPISAEIIEDSNICLLRIEHFNLLLKNNIELTNHLLLFYVDELFYSEEMARDLSQLSVRERVADALLKIKNAYCPSKEDKCVGVLLSRQDIADIAGTTKEQVSKNLAEFKEEKIINLNNKEIIIEDSDRLNTIANHSRF
ncbi:MAG: hypothetical protein A2033_02300 [Bacteroidetes bacterium GWA2_31_9]|nr:MAG: hypothetical protein A2033_02300 [Bacteroidetes bacterium GWA2_31_9]